MNEKTCTKCSRTLPADAFWKGESRCKECLKAQRKENYNPEYHRQYRLDNLESKREYDRARSGDPERVAQIKEWQRDNPEKMKEQRRRNYEDNKGDYLARNRQRKALLKSAEGTHSHEEIMCMLVDQGGLCAYCEKPLGDEYHVDHMLPLSRGGRNDWVNLAVTCPTCNLEKNAKTAEEYMDSRGAVIVNGSVSVVSPSRSWG